MKQSAIRKHTNLIKRKAEQLGFDSCGIAKAEKLHEEEANLASWLEQGFHGNMTYLTNHFDKRLDPTKLVPGARSVVMFTYNYFPGKETKQTTYKVAKYAYGKDYHFVIKDKLKTLMNDLQAEIGNIQGRVFVDSAPVMERQWAAKSGLGWVGKNGLLLNPKKGSFFFLAELILDLDLEPDGPIRDYCGTCTRCLDACPTHAFVKEGVLNASKCISYLTIELKEAIPNEFNGKYSDWVFGCDICQDVCPWNRFSSIHKEESFAKSNGIKSIETGKWNEITEDIFNKIFRESPLKRTMYSGMKRNVDFINKKSRTRRD